MEEICRECRFLNKLDELASKLEIVFFMVSCVSINITFGVCGYVDNRVSQHMILNKKIFSKFQEEDVAYRWSWVMMLHI